MGRLARRISRWTTNALLTAMLLVIALGFGRQVLHWWHDETSPRRALPEIGTVPNGAAETQILAFGDQNWSIRRQEYSGPVGAVPAALVQFCRSVIADVPPRGDTADAAEQDVLKRLAADKPIAEEPSKWRLYQWSEGVPIVIGTRAVGLNAPELAKGVGPVQTRPSQAQGRATQRTNLAEDALSRGNLEYGGSGGQE